MTGTVLVDIDDAVMTITLNRPEVRNAVDREVSYGVCAAIDEPDRRADPRVGILTGAGGTFCAGMDREAFARGEVTSVEGRGILGLARTPPVTPLIAAAEGHALTGEQVGVDLLDRHGLINRVVDAREGALASAGKRAPVWQGR